MKINVVWILAVALLYSLGTLKTHAADKALLIGIGEYKNSIGSPLPGTQADVDKIRRMLIEKFSVAPDDILALRNENATRKAILGGIDEWLIQGTKSGDRVFLYYSGHGYYVEDLSGDESLANGGDGFDETLVPYDVSCTETGCDNMVLDDEIGERLKQLGDRYVLSIFDSCHSGTVTRSMTGTGSAVTKLFQPSMVFGSSEDNGAEVVDSNDALAGSKTRSLFSPQALTKAAIVSHKAESGFIDATKNHVSLFAVQSFQLALEVPLSNDKAGGLFTHSLIDGISNNNADYNTDGSISFGEIKRYTTQITKEFCEKEPRACARGLDPLIDVSPRLLGENIYNYGKKDRPVPDSATSGISTQQVESILSQGNNANLRIAIEPGKQLASGDNLRLKISSDKQGLLLLFDRDSSGSLTMLYPGEIDEDRRVDNKPLGWIRAGGTVQIPDDFASWEYVVEPPYGSGFIIAILAETYQQVPPTPKAFQPVARPAETLGEIRLTLDALVDSLSNDLVTESPEWSVTMLDYEVLQ